jgi:hypothetical protein
VGIDAGLLVKILLVALNLLVTTVWAQTIEEETKWQSLAIDPMALEFMLQEVTVNGPQLFDLSVTPYRSEGEIEGCGYSFQVLLRDWAYRSNEPTIAYGSIVYWGYPDRQPALTLRIGLIDITRRGDQFLKRNTSVNYAYLRGERQSTAGAESSSFEGEDMVNVFVYLDPELEMLEWLMLEDHLTIGFNREVRRTDLEFNVPVISNDVRLADIVSCFGELLENLESK